MYSQTKEIRLTEGKSFPDDANPGDIHAMKMGEAVLEKGSPYWAMHFRKWGFFPSWQFIENLCEADYLKYYGYGISDKEKRELGALRIRQNLGVLEKINYPADNFVKCLNPLTEAEERRLNELQNKFDGVTG